MNTIFNVDWRAVFVPSTPLAEIVVRGSLIYLSLFFILRFVLQREAGTVGITDLLVVVLIADAAQNAMAANYTSVTEGVVLVATIVFWSYALDWLGYHVPAIQRFVRPPPLSLIKDGRLLRHNLRKELITEDELLSQLRKQGVESFDEVKLCAMEGDGHFSVITNDGDKPKPEQEQAPT